LGQIPQKYFLNFQRFSSMRSEEEDHCMDFTPSVNAIQQAEAQVEDVARRLARPPVITPSTAAAQAPKDTVELSADAVALLISRNAVAANVEVIKTENGVSRSLLNLVE
jgi:hypothetical protein